MKKCFCISLLISFGSLNVVVISFFMLFIFSSFSLDFKSVLCIAFDHENAPTFLSECLAHENNLNLTTTPGHFDIVK